MIIISDTSPLSSLDLVGYLSILKDIYTNVVIPQAVANELANLTEEDIRIKAIISLKWIQVKQAANLELVACLRNEYNFNPADVFFRNNALKDTKDWYNATNRLLSKIGIERNVEGAYDDLTQLTLDELQGKFLYGIRDKKALDSFLESRSYTNTLRSQGLDDIDIARNLVRAILADTYKYFHGDSQKYNQALVDTIKSKYDEITKGGTEFVPNAWNEATKALTFDEFSDLTKGFQPSGKMYRM